MNALLFIRDKRKMVESIEFVSMVRLAMNGSKADVEKQMERWAKAAEVRLQLGD